MVRTFKLCYLAYQRITVFIEIAPKVPCYFSLEEAEQAIFTKKIGKKVLCQGEELLVQVQKEAVKTKVPTVTSNLNFTSENVVLTTGNTTTSVSKKLQGEDRARLLEIAKLYESESYGLIIRTNAKNMEAEALQEEIRQLILRYEEVVQKAQTRTHFTCMQKASATYLSYIRDLNKESITRIVVEEQDIYEEVKTYLAQYTPELVEKLELYSDKNYTLNKLYAMEHVMEGILKKRVWMKSGAYLVIEPTEALTVIDVNSGKCVVKGHAEDSYYRVNVEAAKEAARQIRLRNISGIILIDFINLKSREKMQEILKILKQDLQKDTISTKLVDVTKLQLVEITRKKVYKSVQESLKEDYE